VNKKSKIYIAGQEGMVGQSIYRLFKKKNYTVIPCKRKDLDLTNQQNVNQWFKKNKPEIVINAAGRVGGILDNSKFQTDYIYINTMIGFNVLNASLNENVKKLINLGSACIYPKNSKQPITEEDLLTSKLEPTNEGYATAKIASLKYCEHINKKFKKDFFSLQPANLYGYGDNFDLKSSHVIPALLRKFHNAKVKKNSSVEVWGSGNVMREFLNVDDLANAVYFCLKNKIKTPYVNVGSRDYLTIKSLATLIKEVTKYKGKIIFNKNYPDGVKRRKLSTKILDKLGWKSRITLKTGLKEYYRYFIEEVYSQKNKS
jgi:GDP-L-fucose synthase|tara:strand:- start:1702 stop:2646 length:945 start_codon:yes stop_codon:yes gene_type:complete